MWASLWEAIARKEIYKDSKKTICYNALSMSEQPLEQTAQQRALRAFEALVTREDAAIDLAYAALLIATIEYPNLDHNVYFSQLDALARRVAMLLDRTGTPPELPLHLPQQYPPLTIIEAINTVLFEQEQFRGNQGDYYNPDNSYFNKVLENHIGIPITLSLLYMEVGRRLGLPFKGIGLPFHFVVGYRLPSSHMLYIDPFEQGQFMTEQECREHIRRLAGGKIRFHSQWFAPVSPKQFLIRMLTNLKHIYLRKERYEHGLAICDHLVLLQPARAVEYRDRGVMHLQLKHYARALHDLKAYLQLAPNAEDSDEILDHIKTLYQTIAMMN